MTLETEHRKLILLCQSGAFAEAAALGQTLCERFPRQPAVWHLTACALTEVGDLQAAVSAFEQTLTLVPGDASAHFNLGCVLQRQFKLEAAASHFATCLQVSPKHSAALNNLGNVWRDLGRFEAAIDTLRKACSEAPENPDYMFNLATALMRAGRLEDAIAQCGENLVAHPEHAPTQALLLRLKTQVCDFSAFEDFEQSKHSLGIQSPQPPFVFLALEDAPERQLQRSMTWSHSTFPKPAARPPMHAPGDKIRVGYFSSNFHEHPEMFLTAGLFRHHDRARFDIHAYSTARHVENEHADRVRSSVDGFFTVHDQADADVAALSRTHKLDIAIDLNGHLHAARLGIFAHRAAPLQITFLGYSGSVGADFFDYMIADRTVVPDAERAHYAEPLIYMPHTYMLTDNQDPIAPVGPTRAECGLPENARVLCCFNNSYKIEPRAFDIWMRVMRKTPSSVLWLKQTNDRMAHNLRHEVKSRGVDGERLIFAPRVPRPDHLARHTLADVFVDTFHYTAHSTAVDALWAGLPVLTKSGRQFSARVGASLLKTAGLPELIAANETEYETLLERLVQSKEACDALKSKLRKTRASAPLFDTSGYVRRFETALETALDRTRDGHAGADLFFD